MSHNYSVDSTIYRRRADGTIIGVPENKAETAQEQVAENLDGITRVPVTPLPEAFMPVEEARVQESHQPVVANSQSPVAMAPVAYSATVDDRDDEGELRFDDAIDPDPLGKEAQRELKKKAKKFKRSPVGKILHRILVILRIVVVAYVAIYVALGMMTSKALEKTNATPTHPIAATSGTNWLLVGSDSRKGLSSHMQHVLHTGPDTGSQRTDVIMIVHIDPQGNPTLVSLPRDSYVAIPAHTSNDGTKAAASHNKINAAYSFAGAPLLVSTIEQNTGLHIDHYMEIGFAGIKDITDAVNGVTICVAHNYDDKNSNLHVKKGCQHMNGKNALAYVRMRYADPTGDLGRIQRQQQYMAAVLHKAITPGTLLNPLALKKLSAAGTSSVVVGNQDSVTDLLKLGKAMRNLSKGNGQVMTVPVANADATTAAGSSVLWDTQKASALFKKLAAN